MFLFINAHHMDLYRFAAHVQVNVKEIDVTNDWPAVKPIYEIMKTFYMNGYAKCIFLLRETNLVSSRALALEA